MVLEEDFEALPISHVQCVLSSSLILDTEPWAHGMNHGLRRKKPRWRDLCFSCSDSFQTCTVLSQLRSGIFKDFGGLFAVILEIFTRRIHNGVCLDLPEVPVVEPERGVHLLIHCHMFQTRSMLSRAHREMEYDPAAWRVEWCSQR